MGEMIKINDLPIFDAKNSVRCFAVNCNEEAHIWIHLHTNRDYCRQHRKTLEFELIEKEESTEIWIALCPKHAREWKEENKISFKAK